jgi:hypothetical protein
MPGASPSRVLSASFVVVRRVALRNVLLGEGDVIIAIEIALVAAVELFAEKNPR